MNRQKMWTTKEDELLNRAIALTPKSLVQGCEEASRMLHREGFNRSPKACYLHYIKVIRVKKHSVVVEAPKKEPNQTQQLVELVLANRNLVTKAKEYKALLKKSLKSTEEFISDMETMYKYLTDNQLDLSYLIYMAEAKVILTVLVPGTTMLSEEEAAKVPNGKGYLYSKLIVEDNKKHRETYTIRVRKCKPVKQIIKLSQDAYDYMTSPSECPEGFQAFNWKKLTPEQRLYIHLSRLSEGMGGFSFHYDLIQD